MNWFFIILGILLILYIFVTVIKGKFDIVESIYYFYLLLYFYYLLTLEILKRLQSKEKKLYF